MEQKQGVYQIQYIAPPGEMPAMNDQEFLRQLAAQKENATVINTRISCPVREVKTVLQQKFPAPGTLVLWLKHNILWGKWTGSDWHFPEEEEPDEEDVMELRLFNAEAEAHLLSKHGSFVGRLAKDDGSGWRLYTDTVSRLWGEKAEICADGFIRLKDEGRRLEMKIPFNMANAKYYGLKTRNYIGEIGDMGQLGYVDYRFLSLEPVE